MVLMSREAGSGRVKQPGLLGRLLNLAGQNPGLHPGHHVHRVQLQNAVHPVQGQEHPAPDGQAAPAQARARPPGRDREAVGVGQIHDPGHLPGALGPDHHLGPGALDPGVE